jgi:hypothetical protein
MTTDIYQPAAPLSSDTAASLSAIFPLYDEYAKYIADGFLIAPDPQHYPDPQPEPTALINEVVIWLMCGCETFVVVDPRPQFHDFVTVLTAEGGKRLTKLVYRPEGSADLATQAYDNAFMFRYQQRQITSLRQLKTLIEGLAYDQAIIPGWLLDGCDPAQPQRRLVHEKDGAHPTLRDVAHIWMVVDADNLPAVDADGEFDPVLYPERAARYLRRQLPPEFHSAECLWQQSASAGVKKTESGKYTINMKLFFRLSRPLTTAEMRLWMEPVRRQGF